MKLLFKGAPHLPEYHNGNLDLHLVAGQETGDLSESVADALKADFPGIFVDVPKAEPMAEVIHKSPVDRQIKKTEPVHRGRPRR
jgi:hypothetical protein